MRSFIIVVAALLVLLPSLLVLFAPGHPFRKWALWALLAFLAPVFTIGIVQLLPMLTNNAVNATQWMRMVGWMFAASGFFLPWVIFARFLSEPAKN